jgi:hypothetical protein
VFISAVGILALQEHMEHNKHGFIQISQNFIWKNISMFFFCFDFDGGIRFLKK